MHRSAHVDTFARDHLPPREQWPDFLLERPELRYPARLNAAVELLDATVAAGHGERVALRTDAATCTYRQLQAQVDRICRVLVEDLALVPGNRVLLRGPNSPMMTGRVRAGISKRAANSTSKGARHCATKSTRKIATATR